MFSLCFRMCQIALDVQFVFQNVSDRSRSSVCVSECVRLLSMFSLCLKIESDLTHSETQAEHREQSDTFWSTNWTWRVIWHILKHKLNIKSDLTHSETQTEHWEHSDHFLCSVCLSEYFRLLSMFSLCFRMCQTALDVQLMCQIALYVQFVFQNVSDCSLCSVCDTFWNTNWT
jgi:hypothetical protein